MELVATFFAVALLITIWESHKQRIYNWLKAARYIHASRGKN